MRAMLRPMRPSPTRPTVLPDMSCASQRCSGQIQPSRATGAGNRRQPLGERDHQRECALGDRLLGVLRHVDDRNAASHRRGDVDRVDADAILDDALEAGRRVDQSRRHRRVAHQEEVGVGQLARELGLGDAIRQRHQLDAARPQAGVDGRALELPVGAYGFHGSPHSVTSAPVEASCPGRHATCLHTRAWAHTSMESRR